MDIFKINKEAELEAFTFQITDEEGKPIDIPLSGSLGLLALGDIGILAWRAKQKAVKEAMNEQSKNKLQK